MNNSLAQFAQNFKTVETKDLEKIVGGNTVAFAAVGKPGKTGKRKF